jgi:hypothetical protein
MNSEAGWMRFIRAIFSEWGSGVTGGLSAPLFLFALFVSGVPRIASVVLAVVCLYVAAYRVWEREHSRAIAIQAELEIERTKNTMPEIRGELFDFETSTQGHGHEKGVWVSSTLVIFRITVCNHRDVPTNIDRLEIDGCETEPPCAVSNIDVKVPGKSIEELALLPSDAVLHRGIQTHMIGSAFVQINIDESAGPTTVDLTRLLARVVDGFGNEHPLSVRAGEVITFLGA